MALYVVSAKAIHFEIFIQKTEHRLTHPRASLKKVQIKLENIRCCVFHGEK